MPSGVNGLVFAKQLRRASLVIEQRYKTLFNRVTRHVERSILDGSPVTGAPGQPYQSGNLYRSWKRAGSFEGLSIVFYSDASYARIIEDNFRGATLRSSRGGFHSVKLTRAAFNAIVMYELEIVRRAVDDPRGRGSQLRDVLTGQFV